jgi:group I intron endonuclease
MNYLNCIYKIHSKSKPYKFYIGSAINFNRRVYRHKTSLKNQWHFNKILQNHYNKYDKEDLIFQVLESDIEKESLLTREQFYIDTLNPTFNILKIAGSNLGVKLSEETKNKISKASKKRMENEDERKKISKRMKGNNIRKGVLHTEETKKKMSNKLIGNDYAKGAIRSKEFKDNVSRVKKGIPISEQAKNKISLALSKPLVQLTKKGVFIKEWKSVTEAQKNLNIKHIGCCCNGLRKTAGGFKWKYKMKN